MTKLKADEIGSKDILEFLRDESDFSFEMQVLHKMDEMGFDCQHGGTYTDPITNKRREFDIRAKYRQDKLFLSIAMECKNIRANCPLLVSCVKRRKSEAFHDLIIFEKVKSQFSSLESPIAMRIKSSLYAANTSVAKRVEQVGRAQNGSMIGNDTDTFDKLSQAVNSAYDLIENMALYKDETFIHFVLPAIVVPDNRLWRVDYSNTGKQLTAAVQATDCSLFMNQPWKIERGIFGDIWYTLSHLEIITFSALPNYVDRIFNSSIGAFVGPDELIKNFRF
jgi:hypothetical protein